MNLFVYALLCASIKAYDLSFRSTGRRLKTSLHITNESTSYGLCKDGKTLVSTIEDDDTYKSRRSFLAHSLMGSSLLATTIAPISIQASVGTLPEFADTNSVLHGITVRVADQSQQQSMIKFLEDGFDCEVLRKRIIGSVEETWLGFGPEQLQIPTDFTLPISSFAKYGGHAAIHLIYDAKEAKPFYRTGENAPGNNIAYLQLGVPGYRISQMVKNGGNILDAYGLVNVVSPSGLPIRGIVGIAPDPIMFVAINCIDVKKSQRFYEQLGFTVQEYPYCRPNKGLGQFEPIQPEKSVYMAPSSNGLGVLLLKSTVRKIVPNPAVQALNVVYNPASTTTLSDNDSNNNNSSSDDSGDAKMAVVDPSGVSIDFQSVGNFEREERITR
jgi:catechol 2,3-dioxygenase-like lactoylglutathione lyase family enzyme